MGRHKKVSKDVGKANTRLSGIKSIDPTLDMGDGDSVAQYTLDIKACADKLDTYNNFLGQVDGKYNDFLLEEKNLRDKSEAMLIAVAKKYGKDSNEYEQAGGVRKSERKKPVRKPKP